MSDKEYAFVRVELEEKLESVRNKTLGEVDTANVFAITETNPKVTGIAGDVIEQSILGYPPDSRQQPDILVDGVPTEVKTTGLRPAKQGKGLEAKEPMSITAVSLDTIVDEDFLDSNFWHKLEHMLIIYYLYDSDTTVQAAEYARFPIKGYQFHEFDEEEIETLKADWQLVHDFVKHIQDKYPSLEDRKEHYPKLSSALRKELMLIDTAPKYPHPPRFRLKRSTVSALAKKAFGESMEQLPKSYTTYAAIDLELSNASNKYGNKTMREICEMLGIDAGGKSLAEQVVVHIFGGTGKLNKIELFSKIGLVLKTTALTRKGLETEDTKLFTIDFENLTNPNTLFEESQFYEYFSDNQFLFIVFEEPSKDAPLLDNKLLGFKRLSFNEDFIETEVRKVWEEARRLIATKELRFIPDIDKKTGKPKVNKTGVVRGAPNFPKSKDGNIFVRGSGNDSTDKSICINDIDMYRQYVWIKGSYLSRLLKAEPWV